ncbi:phospholipase D-like domain-containing protein [Flavobacterium panacagri]|uniref:phospholipase D-like domain-containing protein n=1 Tax=Flavobacterium panacagri TaxID=3034146 RepID=UPI0025A64933|nr:phospholipase D-like domain-containing protein [Flavobacterium panacagri]
MNDLITNGTEIKQRIISEINNAKQLIYIAMAWFTDRDIAMAIIEAKNRDLTIDIILSSNVQNETVKLMLKGAGINVHAFETGDTRGIMHHKFCLIDNRLTINGSYNYSINASFNNVENVQVSDDFRIYSQFLSEFERLRYNIDHNIGVNTTSSSSITSQEVKTEQPQPINIIEAFSQQLHNLVYSAAQINTEEYKKKGYEKSKDNNGNIEIFRTEYDHIKEEIKTYATDESLGSKKNILISNISNAFESMKTNLETEKQEKITIEKRNSDLETRQIKDKISELKKEKSIIESGNQSTGEKGLLQINKEIEKNKLERRSLEQSFVIKKFWTIGTVLILIALGVFVFYLSIFFASAIYKVFFEGNAIMTSLQAGINPGIPQLVDANAIINIFKQQGTLFGIIAALFFLIPVLLSNLKILGSENKLLNNLMFWVGLLIFDVVVSSMVAINTDEIKSLLAGQKSTMQIWEVVKHGEFYLIFTFGMFPLILTHFLVDYVVKAYKKSKPEMVDAEKNKNIQFLDEEMLELNILKESLSNRIKENETLVNENNSKILNLETEINNYENQIDNKYADLQKKTKIIFDEFNTKITSGKIFTDVIFDSIITAYKSGFIEHLPKYYATDEVAVRVREIEQILI